MEHLKVQFKIFANGGFGSKTESTLFDSQCKAEPKLWNSVDFIIDCLACIMIDKNPSDFNGYLGHARGSLEN